MHQVVEIEGGEEFNYVFHFARARNRLRTGIRGNVYSFLRWYLLRRSRFAVWEESEEEIA